MILFRAVASMVKDGIIDVSSIGRYGFAAGADSIHNRHWCYADVGHGHTGGRGR